jgi:hypothetical protein
MNKFILALLTVSAIATAAVPANAGDIGNVQTSDQNSVITGSGNYTNQRVNQRGQVNQRVHKGDSQDSANIQNANQSSDVYGNGNVTEQKSNQQYRENRTQGGRRQYQYR